MTDVKRERIAKTLLATFQDIWCSRESDEPPYFNCYKCEFKDGDECRVKVFIKSVKYDEDYPQGMIEGGDEA